MKSRKVLSLALTFLMLSTTTAFAKGNNASKATGKPEVKVEQQDKSSKGQDKKQAAQTKKDEKKEQIAAFKTAMREKHAELKELQAQIKTVRQEVQQKKQQLTAIVEQLEAGKTTLPQDVVDSLLKAAQNLKLDVEDVNETAEVQSEVADTQDKVQKADFNNALASMDKVIAKFTARLNALKKLSADLDTALKLANLQTPPAGTPATSEPTGSTATSEPTGNTATSEPTSSTATAEPAAAQ